MSLLKLDPRFDVAFPCPQCSFVARGPGALEEHLVGHEVVVPNATDAVPIHAENAVPVKRKRGRPRKVSV